MKLLALIGAALLSGCSAQATGGGAESPLTNGLHALKAGDGARLAAALATSERAMAPLEAAPDPCAAATFSNRIMAVESDALRAIARPPAAASVSEEARLLLALTYANDSVLSGVGEVFLDCPPRSEDATPALGAREAMGVIENARARGDMLYGWMSEVRSRNGSQYEPRMKAAAALLQQNGVEAEWPSPFSVTAAGGEGLDRFEEVQPAVE